jgi:hypothetical protein
VGATTEGHRWHPAIWAESQGFIEKDLRDPLVGRSEIDIPSPCIADRDEGVAGREQHRLVRKSVEWRTRSGGARLHQQAVSDLNNHVTVDRREDQSHVLRLPQLNRTGNLGERMV